MIKIVNARKISRTWRPASGPGAFPFLDGVGFWVDRSTPLGNPFIIGRDGDRDQVCDEYETWLVKLIRSKQICPQRSYLTEIYSAAASGVPVYLLCWCIPERCHAETIKRLIEKALSR